MELELEILCSSIWDTSSSVISTIDSLIDSNLPDCSLSFEHLSNLKIYILLSRNSYIIYLKIFDD